MPFALPDAEAVAFTRRQFFNRANTTVLAVGLGGFGAAVVAFLWPQLTGGAFGSKVSVGTVTEVRQQIQDNRGFLYVPQGRMWITEYPAAAVARAEKAYPPVVVDAMRAGFVALYQKCPHLGCRVPECLSSQWFECPCHGSQYNRAGEKKAGPAPRGMDRFALTVAGGAVRVDTSRVHSRPPDRHDHHRAGGRGSPLRRQRRRALTHRRGAGAGHSPANAAPPGGPAKADRGEQGTAELTDAVMAVERQDDCAREGAEVADGKQRQADGEGRPTQPAAQPPEPAPTGRVAPLASHLGAQPAIVVGRSPPQSQGPTRFTPGHVRSPACS